MQCSELTHSEPETVCTGNHIDLFSLCSFSLYVRLFCCFSCGFFCYRVHAEGQIMVSPVELCRVHASRTSYGAGCSNYFPELRSCFVLHSTGKQNNTLAIGHTKPVHIAYTGILLFLSFITHGRVPRTSPQLLLKTLAVSDPAPKRTEPGARFDLKQQVSNISTS